MNKIPHGDHNELIATDAFEHRLKRGEWTVTRRVEMTDGTVIRSLFASNGSLWAVTQGDETAIYEARILMARLNALAEGPALRWAVNLRSAIAAAYDTQAVGYSRPRRGRVFVAHARNLAAAGPVIPASIARSQRVPS